MLESVWSDNGRHACAPTQGGSTSGLWLDHVAVPLNASVAAVISGQTSSASVSVVKVYIRTDVAHMHLLPLCFQSAVFSTGDWQLRFVAGGILGCWLMASHLAASKKPPKCQSR